MFHLFSELLLDDIIKLFFEDRPNIFLFLDNCRVCFCRIFKSFLISLISMSKLRFLMTSNWFIIQLMSLGSRFIIALAIWFFITDCTWKLLSLSKWWHRFRISLFLEILFKGNLFAWCCVDIAWWPIMSIIINLTHWYYFECF